MDAPPLVMIVWEDALRQDSETWVENKDHAYKPHLVHQVGFLLAQNEQGVIITSAWHPDTIAPRDQIPLGMIRSMTLLVAAPESRKRRPK